jgi:hypothetical protein
MRIWPKIATQVCHFDPIGGEIPEGVLLMAKSLEFQNVASLVASHHSGLFA